ncbi:MAG: AAA family ATPase [Verrucomicrobia bacterium]|nr:AAA family ATPase [Verrucomicrobiota bacterium]
MSTLELLKTLILDAQADIPFTGVTRGLAWETARGKAFVCMGVRRSGKSTFLAQIMLDLLNRGIRKENILYLNFFDERLEEIKHGRIDKVIEAYFTLYPEKKGVDTVHCFFDEIQEAEGWEAFVSRLLRDERCDIYISGSSSKMLSREIATQMRGRSIAWELFPFSFTEFLNARRVAVGTMTSATRHHLRHAFEEYWKKGGFPEVIDMSDKLRVMTHQEYFKTIVERDIVDRYDALHPQAIRQMAHLLLNSIGSLYTINRLASRLQSAGFKTSKSFVTECLQWFEDAYFLYSTKLLAKSLNRQNVNPKKIYCVDHALAASVSTGIEEDRGHLLENLVFIHLRRVTEKIFYHRTSSGHEVDFVWLSGDRKKHIVQVCYSLKNEATRNREFAALRDAMKELHQRESWLITQEEEDTVEDNGTTIHIVPIWLYLINITGQ